MMILRIYIGRDGPTRRNELNRWHGSASFVVPQAGTDLFESNGLGEMLQYSQSVQPGLARGEPERQSQIPATGRREARLPGIRDQVASPTALQTLDQNLERPTAPRVRRFSRRALMLPVALADRRMSAATDILPLRYTGVHLWKRSREGNSNRGATPCLRRAC
jgi:hypothetical protein